MIEKQALEMLEKKWNLAKLKAVNRKIENLYDEVKVLTASEFKEVYNFS
jgi:hypothetical protein